MLVSAFEFASGVSTQLPCIPALAPDASLVVLLLKERRIAGNLLCAAPAVSLTSGAVVFDECGGSPSSSSISLAPALCSFSCDSEARDGAELVTVRIVLALEFVLLLAEEVDASVLAGAEVVLSSELTECAGVSVAMMATASSSSTAWCGTARCAAHTARTPSSATASPTEQASFACATITALAAPIKLTADFTREASKATKCAGGISFGATGGGGMIGATGTAESSSGVGELVVMADHVVLDENDLRGLRIACGGVKLSGYFHAFLGCPKL